MSSFLSSLFGFAILDDEWIWIWYFSWRMILEEKNVVADEEVKAGASEDENEDALHVLRRSFS